MQSLNESVKSKGIVVFAFNSATVDYVALADQTSKLTHKALGLPITLITDLAAEPKFDYDKVIRLESKDGNTRTNLDGKTVEWRNFGRYLAYELSPYDETILLDGDYLVLDNSLLKLFEQDFDYRLMHNNQSPAGPSYQLMGTYGLPFVWATVVLFRKSTAAKQYFDLINRIQNNYAYYATLFNCNDSYRNDYAFAMANIILNGYSIGEYKSIPWTMLTIEQKINSIEIQNKFLVVKQTQRADVISKQNLHIMDKTYLLSDEFTKFVDKVCNESA
jgi:hypothetical protein